MNKENTSKLWKMIQVQIFQILKINFFLNVLFESPLI